MTSERTISRVTFNYLYSGEKSPKSGVTLVSLQSDVARLERPVERHTTRQSIQLRWLNLKDLHDIWDPLESVGASSRSAGGDTTRNISSCPVAGKDAREIVETRLLLDEIQTGIRDDDALANMPHKFNISSLVETLVDEHD